METLIIFSPAPLVSLIVPMSGYNFITLPINFHPNATDLNFYLMFNIKCSGG